MLTVVSWKWRAPSGYRSHFTGEHVNILAAMVARNYSKPHRFVCVTDNALGIDGNIEIIPLWNDFAHVQSPHGPGNPSCYRRLKAFAPEMAEVFGERFISIDLDTVIVADVSPIFDRQEDFIIWGDTNPTSPYNGGLFMMNAGARRKVWETFDPAKSPTIARKLGYFGSDQAWIGACLGRKEARWTTADVVYSYRNHIARTGALPAGARIISFHGQHDPWHPGPQKHAWVRNNYRCG